MDLVTWSQPMLKARSSRMTNGLINLFDFIFEYIRTDFPNDLYLKDAKLIFKRIVIPSNKKKPAPKPASKKFVKFE